MFRYESLDGGKQRTLCTPTTLLPAWAAFAAVWEDIMGRDESTTTVEGRCYSYAQCKAELEYLELGVEVAAIEM